MGDDKKIADNPKRRADDDTSRLAKESAEELPRPHEPGSPWAPTSEPSDTTDRPAPRNPRP